MKTKTRSVKGFVYGGGRKTRRMKGFVYGGKSRRRHHTKSRSKSRARTMKGFIY